jgi:hypothetical protein
MDAETIAHGSKNVDHAHALSGSSVNQIRIGLDGMTLGIVVSLVIVIGACGVVMGLNLSKQHEQDAAFRDLQVQYKLVERRELDLEAYGILNGWKMPSDNESGPTGNLQRMKPKEK